MALVLGLVIAFKQIANPAATLAYGALYGVALGAISEAFNTIYPGIVMQALIGTFGVFAGMLIVYKTGAIRVTPKLTRWVFGALIGALVLLLVNMIGYWVGFDLADEAIRRGAPAKFAWYIAFGLLVTVIWLYIEILRLLSYFRE